MTPQDASTQSSLSALPAWQGGGRQSRHLIQLLISCVSLRNRKRQLIFYCQLRGAIQIWRPHLKKVGVESRNTPNLQTEGEERESENPWHLRTSYMDGSLSLCLRAESGRGGEIWPRKKVPKWHHSQTTSLSPSLRLLLFVPCPPSNQNVMYSIYQIVWLCWVTHYHLCTLWNQAIVILTLSL